MLEGLNCNMLSTINDGEKKGSLTGLLLLSGICSPEHIHTAPKQCQAPLEVLQRQPVSKLQFNKSQGTQYACLLGE